MTFQATVAERISSALQDEHGGDQFLHFVKAVSSELNQEDQSPGSGQLRTDTKRKVRETGPLKNLHATSWGGGGAHESEKP